MNDSSAKWLPSVSAMIWIALFAGLSLSGARIPFLSADSDSALHRRLGDWMIEHRAIVREDRALHTHEGRFITKEWLSELIFAAAGKALGWNGVVLVAAALVATCFWLLHRQLLAEGTGLWLATGLVAVAMFACSMHWLARPHLFTHLLTVVFAGQLRRGRTKLLIPLMVLWVNLHGAFMTGLVLIGLHALGQKSKSLWVLFAGCAAATLINPNGWRLPALVLDFFRSSELSTLTTEFGSPNFHTVGVRGFALLLLVIALVLLVVRPKLSATEILLVGGWGCLALLSARNIPIFTLVVVPLVARWLGGVKRTQIGSEALPIGVAVVCVLAIMPKTDFPSNRYPTDAVTYLRQHTLHGEMFNYFLWGGYLEYALPGRRPFIDSRNDFYGVELVREFRTANEPKPGWEEVFAKYNVGWTILPVQHPLNRILELSLPWHLVYSNELTLVFNRAS